MKRLFKIYDTTYSASSSYFVFKLYNVKLYNAKF